MIEITDYFVGKESTELSFKIDNFELVNQLEDGNSKEVFEILSKEINNQLIHLNEMELYESFMKKINKIAKKKGILIKSIELTEDPEYD